MNNEDLAKLRRVLAQAGSDTMISFSKEFLSKLVETAIAERRKAQAMDAIQSRCIERLTPVTPDGRTGWRCRVCNASGEYPGLRHFGRCPVRSLGSDQETKDLADDIAEKRRGALERLDNG